MLGHPKILPVVVSLPHKFPGMVGFGTDEDVHNLLEAQGVWHVRYGHFSAEGWTEALRLIHPGVIFRQAPWDPDLPPEFSTSSLIPYRVCYIPYGFNSLERYQTDPAGPPVSPIDQEFLNHCWRIFCETKAHRDLFVERSPRKGQNVTVVGYPKFDQLLRARATDSSWPLSPRGSQRALRVIWAPHHSLTDYWLSFGTFHQNFQEFLALAKARQDIDFVLKPHPALFGFAVKDGFVRPEALQNFLAEWKALRNTCLLEEYSDYGPLFRASDVMVTDGISFLFEYQVLGKPVIFVDSGRHVPFNPIGTAAVRSTYTVGTVGEVVETLERLRNGVDPKARARRATKRLLVPFPGQSAKRVLRVIDRLRKTLT